MKHFIEILRFFDNYINETLRNLINNFDIVTVLLLILISFIYGILHSLGPGHGKALVASFFLKEKHPVQKSLLLAAIISIIHTGSAIILAILFRFVLTGLKGIFRIKLQNYFITASGILIIIIGILFFILKIIHKNNESIKLKKNTNIFLVGVSAGIIPCPVALTISLLTLSKNIFIIGILSVTSISLGMFILISLVGFLSIILRDQMLTLSNKLLNKGKLFSIIIEYVSIILIIIIGAFMVFKTLL
ncbi:MAG TPA: hypothetical protein PLG34_00005 [Spirochaetota bacterium]|nr:MAG: nickel/cobalt efflux protein RcnA [Spirochaetes bacterium ADurb.Bin133]HNZ25852.1 hypothetical protein [Spirochaetota bacterium]HPY86351.1 hypothetical protein [Spirochaetota bacterium]HQB62015.1 hypothetical protein [Spirochaetota bacterium]